jgi:hypothetical protein
MFLDDSACNLASLNLLKFAPNGTFDVEAYRHAVDITITAQEILVDNAGYPTEIIGKNSHDYRPLGLGYANLGALLMAAGLPYDSDAGRDYAACVTAIMCGEAYLQSSKIAEQCEPLFPSPTDTEKSRRNHLAEAMPGAACPGWYINREPFLDVIRMHRVSVNNINKNNVPSPIFEASKAVLGRSSRPRRKAWLPQRAGHRAGSHRNHRLHDGLRHHRRRARSRAGQIQEAGRRRHDQDRQPHRAPARSSNSDTRTSRPTPSSATSTPPEPSKARRTSKTSISPSSIARSSRRRARAPSPTWDTSR